LGLDISYERTEPQHNKYVIPCREGQYLEIGQEEEKRQIKFQPVNKALRYLGFWSTANWRY